MKDSKTTALRGHTSPPPGLAREALNKWVEENSSALGATRDAEFSARKKKAIEATRPPSSVATKAAPVAFIPPPEKPPGPTPRRQAEPKPIGASHVGALKTPEECGPIHFDNQTSFRQIEGRRPKDEAELAGKIKRIFELPHPEVEEFKFSFQAVRMLRGIFLDDFDKASEFRKRFLTSCLTFDELLGFWDQVKLPSWLVEGFVQQIPESWDHPALDHPRQIKSKTRRLAGVAYRLQDFFGNEWFRMDQIEIAQLIESSQQEVSRCLRYLSNHRWLECRGAKGNRSNEYRCLAYLQDAAQDEQL